MIAMPKESRSLKSLLERLRSGGGDALVAGSASAFSLNVAGQGLAFLLQLLLARLVGADEYGFWSYGISALAVALIVAKLGFDSAIVRFLPMYRVHGNQALFRGLAGMGRYLPAAVGAFIGVVMIVGSLSIANQSWHRAAWLIVWLLLPISVLSELSAIVLRALRYTARSLVGDAVCRPVLTGLLVIGAYSVTDQLPTSATAMLAYATATTVVCAIHLYWVRARIRIECANAEAEYRPREWLTTSLPLMMAGGFQTLLYSIDILMLGALVDTTASGAYSIASRIALLALFAMTSIQMIAGPLFAETMARGRVQDLQRLVTITVWLSVVVALPVTLVIIAFGSELLGLFGADFTAATGGLTLLAAAQFFNVMTGPVGVLLSTTGRHMRLMGYLGVGLAVNVALNIWLIPTHGVIGAGLSALAGQVVWNGLAAIFVWRRMGINCTPFARLR